MPKKNNRFYNRTNTCDRCRKEGKVTKLYAGNALMEKDNNGNWTGRWGCKNCWQKYDPNSTLNIIKSISNCRTGNQNANHSNTKGKKFQKLTCLEFGYIDLNIESDNYNSPIDLIDPKTKLKYQVKGRWYDSTNKYWNFGDIEREHFKEFKDMICYCASKDGKKIERIYRFPKEEINNRIRIAIVKNPMNARGTSPIVPWYEKYRYTDEEELKKANEIWMNLQKCGIK